MNNIPTPHINAKKEDIARVVLMPGDPLRSKFVAENFLENARLVNNIRGVQGYTGDFCGVSVSVMASGMGMPSIGIYSYELYNFYDVELIVRIGSAGAIAPEARLGDIIFGMGACTNSSYGEQFGLVGSICPICDFDALTLAVEAAREQGVHFHVGSLLSSDTFYTECGGGLEWQKMGVLAVEMEAAALYMNAMRAGKRALAMCTVSDSLVTGEAMSAEQRQTGFFEMMRIALLTAKRFSEENK